MEKRSYSLKELCQVADVTERTVRFYIQEGLLPPPVGAGPFSRYNYEHWLRLQFIKRLKDEFLPLAHIKNLLVDKSLAELQQLAEKSGLLGNQKFLADGDMRMENWLTGSNTLRQQLQETPAVYDYKAVASFADVTDDEDKLEAEGWKSEDSNAQAAPPPTKPVRDTGKMAKTADIKPAPRPMAAPPPSAPISSGPAPVPPGAMPPTMQLATSAENIGLRREARFSPALGSINFEPGAAFETDDVPLPVSSAPVIPATTDGGGSLAKADIVEEFAASSTQEKEEKKQRKAVAPLDTLEVETEVTSALGELWEKITLAPGVELYVERQIAASKQNELQTIIEQARQLLRENS